MKTYVYYLILIASLISCNNIAGTITDNRDLTKTTWKYIDDKDLTYNVTFKPNGYLKTTNSADVTPKNDRWEQNGNTVKYSYNDQYAIYTGKFVTVDLITGSTINKVGKKWKWRMERIGR